MLDDLETRQLFSVEMVRVSRTLTGKKMDAETMQEYFRAMRRLSIEQVRYAVDKAIERERFVPPPVVLIEYGKLMPKIALPSVATQKLLPTIDFDERERQAELNRTAAQRMTQELTEKLGWK